MDTQRWKKVEELFAAAADMGPAEREAFLARETAGDPDLLRDVMELLAHDRSDSAVGRVVVEAAHALATDSMEDHSPGSSIGPFTIVRLLGEGGFGRVYLAEQGEPLRRHVALKLLKAGMDTKQVIARFEAERQLLARMNHPGIASVIDAGSTADGRPYFAMEYVEGVPITWYCTEKRLDTAARLALFVDVCRAVQHAHQKGVIHRDIKPSNVLVTEAEGRAQVKVIDFGIAKAIETPLDYATMLTREGVLVGTPSYMSPEQASGKDIDTRTDVYSLGVLLYELLAGEPPFTPSQLRAAGVFEMHRLVCEMEPEKPSSRVASTRSTSGASSAKGPRDPRSLERALRGDLDWIALKALAKEPDRRYAGPDQLAEDVLRHLRLEPVEAGPPSAAYRAGKFVRRHRAGVGAAAFALVALITGLALAASGFVRASRERDAAEAVTSFLIEIFQVSDPELANGETLTAREVLDRGARRIREERGQDPATRARLTNVIGRVYRNIGLHESAGPLLTQALEERRALLGSDHRDVAETLLDLCILRQSEGRFDESEALCRESLAVYEARDGRRSLTAAKVLTVLADTLGQAGRHEDGERAAREALEIRIAAEGEESPDATESRLRLGQMLAGQGNLQGAVEEYRRVLAVRERLYDPDHSMIAQAVSALAVGLHDLGELQEAEALYARSMAIDEKIFGPRHHFIATHLNNLAVIHMDRAEWDLAIEKLTAALSIYEETVGRDHPDSLSTLSTLANAYHDRGDIDRAIAIFEEALPVMRERLAPDHPTLVSTIINFGSVGRTRGDLERSAELFREALALQESGPETHILVVTLHNLGQSIAELGDFAEGERYVQRAVEASDRVFGPRNPQTASFMATLASIQARRNKFEDARRNVAEAVAIMEASPDPGNVRLRYVLDIQKRLEAYILEHEAPRGGQ